MVPGKTPSRPTSPSRRLTSRVPTPGDVWVYWRCHGREDVSRVRDMSLGGVFIETSEQKDEGVRARLDFLVQEGQICADGEVRHPRSDTGVGMKLTALGEQVRQILVGYLTW